MNKKFSTKNNGRKGVINKRNRRLASEMKTSYGFSKIFDPENKKVSNGERR